MRTVRPRRLGLSGIQLAVSLLSFAGVMGLVQFVSGQELPGGASRSTGKSRVRITVRIYNHARAPRPLLERAEREASAIFVKAGIEVEWVDCPLTEAEMPLYPGCQRDFGPTDLVLRLLPEHMAKRYKLRDTILGFAMSSSHGQRAYVAGVFYDRTDQVVQGNNLSADLLLGHVVAHELGHLLLGSNGHSRTGLMNGTWGPGELRVIGQAPLLFTPQQSQQMRVETLGRMRWQQFGTDTLDVAGPPIETHDHR